MTNDLQRLAPQNVEAEASVLGGILRENDSIFIVAGILSAGDFYRESHRKIYRAMSELVDRRDPIDMITLSEMLNNRGELDGAGGSSYIATLSDNVPSSANVEHYAKIVREKADARRLLHATTDYQTRIYEAAAPALDLAAGLSSEIARIQEGQSGGFVPICDVVVETMKQIEKAAETKQSVTGIPTGFRDIDSMMGGIHRGELVVIAARPGMGKTAAGADMALGAALQGYHVGFVSAEMTRESIVQRYISRATRIENRDLRRGRIADGDYQRIFYEAEKLGDLTIWLLDRQRSWDRIKPKIHALKVREGLDVLVIDYAQLLQAGMSDEKRYEEVGRISSDSKGLAMDLDISVLLLSQLNRELEKRPDKRPQLSDLRESGNLEQDADVVAFLYRDVVYHEKTAEPTLAEYLVRKNRNGPIGMIKLKFTAEQASFSDYEEPSLWDQTYGINSHSNP